MNVPNKEEKVNFKRKKKNVNNFFKVLIQDIKKQKNNKIKIKLYLPI